MILLELTQSPQHAQIKAWLKKHKISKHTIRPDGIVDVMGDVALPANTTTIPVQFGTVSGYFYCHNTQITSLQGAPQSVGGDFSCHSTQITSLQGAPQSVGGNFSCYATQITSLQGAPQSVGGYFYCHNTPITSLQGAPQSVGGYFSCNHTQITSLQGAPQSVGGYFSCINTQITSLQGIHKTHRTWVIKGMLIIPEQTIHIIGLALIPGISVVQLGTNGPEFDISHHDPLEFQEQLIDAGFKMQARM
jgi:hypothetical protein